MKDRRSEAHPKYGLIVIWATEDADSDKQDWPGIPLSSIPLVCRDELHAAIRDNKVQIVERPAKVQGRRTARFVAPVR